jgi:predicted alpha/beta-hydrolase family hydrolase
MTDIVSEGPPQAATHIVLAHGAGAPLTSPFLHTFARLLTERGLRVTRFNFAYMAARQSGGKRRPPPKAELLVPEYVQIVEQLTDAKPAAQKLVIGGKSMGGRVASIVADDLGARGRIAGLVCLGYPFHPTAKPEQLRIAHLATLATPALVVQGERDPFGNRAEVEAMRLSPAIRFCWIGDGDHDFGPRGGSGLTRKGNLATAAQAVAEFAAAL